MGVKAILSSLPYKIKADTENEIWRKYMARNVRMIGENTANMVQGKFMSAEYDDIINPKPVETRTPEEIIGGIKDKLNKMK